MKRALTGNRADRRLASRLGAAVLGLAAMAGGCGGDVQAADPFKDGTVVNGNPFKVASQAALQVQTTGDVRLPAGWVVELSDQAPGCWAIMNQPPDATLMQVKFPTAGVGTYDVTAGNTLFSAKANRKAALPVAGKLQLLTVDNSHLVGTYDVTFETGERIASAFDAELCQ